MVTKAIIEEVINEHQVRVRIPLIHKMAISASATPFKELPIAQICCTPGINILYSVGDVVYVSYEDDLSSKIVVLGDLSVSFDTGSYPIFNCVVDGGSW